LYKRDIFMRKYKLWNKTSKINGIEPSRFLNYEPFKDYDGDIILIYNEDKTKIAQVESKQVLSEIYNIDYNLPLDDFMTVYFEKSKIQPEEN